MKARALYPKVRGFGAYKIKSNSLMYGGMSPPMIKNSMDRGSVIIRHREYVGDIAGTVSFTNRNFPINPGLNGTFPWLSQVAAAFEQYRFRGMIWEFKSTSADSVINAQPNVGMGTVVMATQYNSLDPGFTNKIEMENYEYANSSKPAVSFIHPVECALNQTPNTPLYVRTGAIPADADERLYDMGNFNVATSGLAADGGVIGELWVTFEIELFKPKFQFNEALELAIDHFAAGKLTGTGINSAFPFGSLDIGFYKGNIGCRIVYETVSGNQTIRVDFPDDGTINPDNYFFYSLVYTTSTASDFALNVAANQVQIITSQGFDPVTPAGTSDFTLATTASCNAYGRSLGSIPANWTTRASNGTTLASTSFLAMCDGFIKAVPWGAGQAASGPRHINFRFLGLSTVPSSNVTADLFIMRVASNNLWANEFLRVQNLSEFGTDV